MNLFSFLTRFLGKTSLSERNFETSDVEIGVSRSKKMETAENTRPRKTGTVSWRNGSFPLDVVGESNYQNALSRICGPHTRYGYDVEVPAIIEHEPENPHDTNAVVVKISGYVVGYLAREQAQRVAEQMRDCDIELARCSAKIVGGWRTNQWDEGSFGVKLGIPQWGDIDFGIARLGTRVEEPKTHKSATKRPARAESGPLSGERIVVWGEASDGPIAHELAALGAHIMAGVGKSTSLLVYVGEKELTPGMRSSAFYRKAKQLILNGSPIEIVHISELRERVGSSPTA